MKIIGAGLAGLLAGNMLRKYNPTILESAPELPNNHTALLRHRESKISEATAIPFKKVKVKKAISYNNKLYSEPNILFSNLYSRKVTGGYFDRSIDNLETVTRFIAPPDFINQLSIGCNISYKKNFDFTETNSDIIISTIPMPSIAKILGYKLDFEFEYRKINVVNFFITNPDCELYQTIYYPDPNMSLYRGSITGNKCIFEFLGEVNKSEIFKSLNQDFGIESVELTEFKEKQNKYGKIKEVSESQKRKDFIGYLTKKHNIYSLGRYATWRNLLLDDVHDDILVIKRLIETNGYIT